MDNHPFKQPTASVNYQTRSIQTLKIQRKLQLSSLASAYGKPEDGVFIIYISLAHKENGVIFLFKLKGTRGRRLVDGEPPN